MRGWTDDMRMLGLYLISCPHRNMVGLFWCAPGYMAADLQWDPERIRIAFESLCASGFIAYDPDAQVVLVRNALKHDAPSTAKQVQGAIAVLQSVPATPLLAELHKAALRYCPALAEAIAAAFPLNAHANPMPPECKPNTGSGSVSASDSASASDDAANAIAAEADLGASPGVPYQAILSLYHRHCAGWPRVQMLTRERRQSIREWWGQIGDLARFELAFQRAGQSDFLSGRNGRWKSPKPCDLDWLLAESHLAAVLEGAYDNRQPRADPTPPGEVIMDIAEFRKLQQRRPDP